MNTILNRRYGKTEFMLQHIEKVAKENPDHPIHIVCSHGMYSKLRERFQSLVNVSVGQTEILKRDQFQGIPFGDVFIDHKIVEQSWLCYELKYEEAMKENNELRNKLYKIKALLADV